MLPTAGSTYPANKLNASWHQFTAGGTDWAILSLPFEPTAADLSWANGVVAADPSRQFIINTHAYLIGTLGVRNAIGEGIWEMFVRKHANIVMVICGHSPSLTPKKLTSVGDHGNTVHQVLSCFHVEPHEPVRNSYLRILTFRPTQGLFEVKTYSPRYNTY